MESKGEFEKPTPIKSGKEREEIFSRYVNAGRRRYFFDVKATRADDYYLAITESTRRYNDDGTERYERHRLFLYKEDFDKFSDRLAEVTDFIKRERGETPIRQTAESKPTVEKVEDTDGIAKDSEFTDVKFEDLGETSEENEATSDGEEKGNSSPDLSPEAIAEQEDSSPVLEDPSEDGDQPSAETEEEANKAE